MNYILRDFTVAISTVLRYFVEKIMAKTFVHFLSVDHDQFFMIRLVYSPSESLKFWELL